MNSQAPMPRSSSVPTKAIRSKFQPQQPSAVGALAGVLSQRNQPISTTNSNRGQGSNRGRIERNERQNVLRQSNSESVIFDRKIQADKKLDPRIYPSWWGEEPSPANPMRPASQVRNQNEAPKVAPETSLERGMREIKETAKNLDMNLKRFHQDYRESEQQQ